MIAHASAVEINFDCLVGPTHHFGGLSYGNKASLKNKASISNPKKAALQGLKKMQFLAKRGFMQGVLPPHERPHFKSLKNLGFLGPDEKIVQDAYQKMPTIATSLCSASSMWAANAATVSPSMDSLDNKLHISPSNLTKMFHRSIESEFSYKVFQKIFFKKEYFYIHEPLLAHDLFSDEGAANHARLCPEQGVRGLQLFVYGKKSTHSLEPTKIFPCRQSELANLALALRHKLDNEYFLSIQQNPEAIDAGAFHNDVVSVANEKLFLCHECAFVDQDSTLKTIRKSYQKLFNDNPSIIEIKNNDLSLEDVVNSYLFNSQILTKKNGKMLLFAPFDCFTNKKAYATIQKIIADDNPLDEVEFFDLSESMANGGGPACLRLRIPLTLEEASQFKQAVLLTDNLYYKLENIINKYYIENFTFEHLFDKDFLNQSRTALEEISNALDLGSLYDFQMV